MHEEKVADKKLISPAVNTDINLINKMNLCVYITFICVTLGATSGDLGFALFYNRVKNIWWQNTDVIIMFYLNT